MADDARVGPRRWQEHPPDLVLFRLGEASALRETGELDQIIAALQPHAERRYVDVDELEVDAAPMIGTMAAVRALWDSRGVPVHFRAPSTVPQHAHAPPQLPKRRQTRWSIPR